MKEISYQILKHLKQHWSGVESWITVLAINLIGVTLVVRFLLLFVNESMDIVFNFVLVLVVSVLIWQLVGGVRATLHQQDRSSGLAKSLILAGGVLGVLVTTVAGVLGHVANRNIDPELGKYIPPKSIVSTRSEGAIVEIDGEIDYRTLADLEPYLNQDLKVLVLSSEGGNVFAARVISRKLVELNIETKISAQCYSACSMIFLSGRSRTLGPNGKIGFHGYSVEGNLRSHLIDIEKEEEIDKLFYRSRNLNERFVENAFSFGPNENWLPSREELIEAGVLTQQ